jgi:hypothetical protein
MGQEEGETEPIQSRPGWALITVMKINRGHELRILSRPQRPPTENGTVITTLNLGFLAF